MKCIEMKRLIEKRVREFRNNNDTVIRGATKTLRSLRVREVNGKRLLYKTIRDKNDQFNNLDVWCVDPIGNTFYIHPDIMNLGPYDWTVGEVIAEAFTLRSEDSLWDKSGKYISISDDHMAKLILSKKNFREEDH